MICECNGRRLLTASVQEPRRGAWVADVEVESAQEVTNPITITLGSTQAVLVGTVLRGGLHQGRWVARVIGGAGGLGRALESRYYDAIPAKTVLADLLRDCGEKLDAGISTDVLARTLGRWLRPAGTAAQALDDLADELGVMWRATRAGTIWLGTDRWPEIVMQAEEVDRDPHAGTVTLAPAEAALARPGVTYAGRRLGAVTTTLAGGKLRQVAWADEGAGDRLLGALRGVVQRVLGRRLDYLASYPATVVRQTPDGLALEVLPDDARIRGQGLVRVPIRHGSPGWGVRVPSGTRVSVRFDAGDPSRPYVADWEPGSVDQITIAGGTQGAVRLGDLVMVPIGTDGVTDVLAKIAACFLVGPGLAVGSPIVVNPAIMAALVASPLTAYGCTSSASTKVQIGG